MAYRYRTNGSLSNQTRLPPIRGRSGIAQNPKMTIQVNELEDGYSPLSFLKLPRLESRSTVTSETPLSFQQTEQKHESFKSYARTDENFLPLRQAAAKCGTGSLERSRGFKGAIRHEETYIHSSAQRIDGVRLEGVFPNNGVDKGKPIAEKVFRRPVQLLRRRLRPCKAYQCSNGQMSHDELLSFEQNMDQLRAFTERDKMIELKDFNGQKFDPGRTGNSDITSHIAMFEVESKANNRREAKKCASMEKTRADEETNLRVRGRFNEAVDHHFYHYYRSTHPERRMGICEEIERSIVVDDLALTSFRESLCLQDVMNTWML